MKQKYALFIVVLSMLSMASNSFAAKPKEVTVGYLNLVNAQLVTKSLGLVQKEMPGVKINYIFINTTYNTS